MLPNGTRTPIALIHQGEQMSGSFRQTQAEGDYSVELTAGERGSCSDPRGTVHGVFPGS